MARQHSEKMVILDLEAQIQARSLVYDERFHRYLSPPIPDDELSREFFRGVKKIHNEGFTGAGMTVGIVDTGIMREHPALRDRCVASKNFTDSRDDIDRHGHGTTVALLILAIAPDVMFVSAKALNDQGEGRRENLLKAMKWAEYQGIQVLNLSLGVEEDEPAADCHCDVCSEANRLVLNGIAVCAALGNDPSKSYHPASASRVMTTSVLGERGFPSYISARVDERMRRPDITVPQFVVPTLGGPFDGATSMGTAYLSGTFALLSQVSWEHLLSSVEILPDQLEKSGITKGLISDYYIDQGVTAYRRGLIPEAIKLLKLSLDNNPTNQAGHYNLGMAYVAAGNLNTAVEEFQWVLRHDPYNVDARINLGHVYNLLGEDDKAIILFQEALELEPSSALAMKNLAFMMCKRGDINAAGDLYNQAVMLDPNNAEIHNDLGYIYEEKGKLADALSHFEAAIRLAPDWDLPRKNRATVLKKIKKMKI